jgi:hypothetical protein
MELCTRELEIGKKSRMEERRPDWSDFVKKMGYNSTTVKESITTEELDLSAYAPNKGKQAWLIHNVLTPDECEQLIALTEAAGYGFPLLFPPPPPPF